LQIEKTTPQGIEFEFTYNIKLSLYENNKATSSMRNNLIKQLKPWAADIDNSIVTVNKVICKPQDKTAIKEKFNSKGKCAIQYSNVSYFLFNFVK